MRIHPIETYFEEDVDDRTGRPWPPEEDCPGCGQHKDGPHRFTCRVAGARQIVATADRVQSSGSKG
jgi:hypothetical protein